jgi:hypothetical protein
MYRCNLNLKTIYCGFVRLCPPTPLRPPRYVRPYICKLIVYQVLMLRVPHHYAQVVRLVSGHPPYAPDQKSSIWGYTVQKKHCGYVHTVNPKLCAAGPRL